MNFLTVFYGYYIANAFKTFGEEHIDDDHFLSSIGAVASFCSALRFVFGFMIEKLSFKTCYTILIVLEIIVTATIYWAVRVHWLYMIWVALSIFLEGGHFTLMPAVCGKVFGNQASQVFSIAFISFGIASLTGVFVVKVLLNKIIGYLGLFIICLVFQVIALALLWLLF